MNLEHTLRKMRAANILLVIARDNTAETPINVKHNNEDETTDMNHGHEPTCNESRRRRDNAAHQRENNWRQPSPLSECDEE